MSKTSVCPTCHGHGYRVELGSGATINAESAAKNGITGKKIVCHCAKKGRAPKVALRSNESP